MSNIPSSPGAYRLIKDNVVIYVGSAKNLLERYFDWANNPDNPHVKQRGWDTFAWQTTSTHNEARRLELKWYYHFQPVCNMVAPPGAA